MNKHSFTLGPRPRVVLLLGAKKLFIAARKKSFFS
jgi:hypothetical protein